MSPEITISKVQEIADLELGELQRFAELAILPFVPDLFEEDFRFKFADFSDQDPDDVFSNFCNANLCRLVPISRDWHSNGYVMDAKLRYLLLDTIPRNDFPRIVDNLYQQFVELIHQEDVRVAPVDTFNNVVILSYLSLLQDYIMHREDDWAPRLLVSEVDGKFLPYAPVDAGDYRAISSLILARFKGIVYASQTKEYRG